MSVHSLGELSSYVVLILSFPVLGAYKSGVLIEDEGEPPERRVPKASAWVASRKRRLFEWTVALVTIAGLLPVLALCWLLVRCTSRGPAFFRQRRMGRNGQEFELYKFRSMRCEADEVGPSHTVHNDLRITRVGALLRRYKLDELPQFWNVLKGDMSLVGPRPKLPRHEVLHMPYRPGLTGRATLAFRHEERMLLEIPSDEIDLFYEAVVKPIKVELDVCYMEKATFLSDVRVLARTMVRCLKSSVDGRRELKDLLNRYAPEHLDRLAPPRSVAPVISLRPPALDAELNDEFAGDLDDAA